VLLIVLTVATEDFMKLRTGNLCAIIVSALLLTGVAQATLIWDGSTSKGIGVFGNLNCDPPGTVTAVNDATFGSVWRFDKPAGDRRCEAHGAAGFHAAIGGTYYIGWRSRLTSTADDNANFQWKAFGRPLLQNFPLVLKNLGGKWMLGYSANGSLRPIFQTAASAGVWHSHVLLIHVSDKATVGYVEYWLDGKHVTFINGSTRFMARTFDGTSVDPKWGVYGGTSVHMQNFVTSLKIGTTFADVAP
jgi:hypothetical protein